MLKSGREYSMGSVLRAIRCLANSEEPGIDTMKERELDNHQKRKDEKHYDTIDVSRARVPQTGEREERDIRLDVLEPPSWLQQVVYHSKTNLSKNFQVDSLANVCVSVLKHRLAAFRRARH